MTDYETPNDVFAYPAHIARAVQNTDDLLKIVKKLVEDDGILEEHEPYFWRAEISNNQLDSYYTRMHKTSLQNYAIEAAEGVSFLTGHDSREQALGRSLTGKYTGASGNGVARVVADFYTLRGLQTNKLASDEFIKGVRGGIIKDVSIGFYGGMFRCSICNNDLWSWDCWHIPGVEYDILDDEGRKTGKRELCTASVENSHLSEVSAVYDGITPGAAIRKAEIEIRNAGQRDKKQRINLDSMNLLQSRYRYKLPAIPYSSRGIPIIRPQAEQEDDTRENETIQLEENDDMILTDEQRRELEASIENEGKEGTEARVEETTVVEQPVVETPSAPEVVAIVVTEARIEEPTISESSTEVGSVVENEAAEDGEGDVNDMEQARAALLAAFEAAGVEPTDDPLAEATRMIGDMPRLRRLADMGTEYRVDVVNQAITEGIRARGEKFKEEQWRATLGKLELEEVKRFRDDWKDAADEMLSGGRVVRETGEETEEAFVPRSEPRHLPDAAFVAR